MWTSLFSFNVGNVLFDVVQDYKAKGTRVPFTEEELNRLRFAVPVAVLALWFDNTERAQLRQEARDKPLMALLIALSVRDQIRVRVGSVLALPKELQLANRQLRPGWFKRIEDHIASEEEILRCVFDFRFKGFRMALRELWQADPSLVMMSRDVQNFKRFEVLAYPTALCAIPNEREADDRERASFLTDIFILAQDFFDGVAIPAFSDDSPDNPAQ